MHSGYYVQQPVYTSGSMIQTSPQYVVQQPGSIEMQSVSMPGQMVQQPQQYYAPTYFTGARSVFSGAANFMGLSFLTNAPQQQVNEEKIMSDYEIHYTADGVPYMVPKSKKKKKKGDDDDSDDEGIDGTDDEARNEHKKKVISLFASNSTIEKEFGLAIWTYFDFVNFIILINFILGVIQLVNYISFVGMNYEEIQDAVSRGTYVFLFSSEYHGQDESDTEILRWIWWVTNVIAIIATFFFGPLYVWRVRSAYKRKQATDTEGHLKGTKLDIIEANQKVGRISRLLRICVTYTIFLTLLGGMFVLAFFLTRLQNDLEEEKKKSGGSSTFSTSFWISMIITVSISVLNAVFKSFALSLSKFEKHKTWTSFRKHNTFKIVLFKIGNVFVVGLSKGFANRGEICPLATYGDQYFYILLMDVLLYNFLEIFTPYIMDKVKQCLYGCLKMTRKYDKDEDLLPDFNTTDEYLEIIYRQYIIYVAMPSFPLAPMVGFIGNIVELLLDRYKLFRKTKTPPRSSDSGKSLLTFFMILAAVLAAINIGAGNIYQLRFAPYWCDYSDPPCSDACKIF